jgi:hypothetical protein
MISQLASLYVAPGGGDKIELLPAVISQRLKRKTPELLADPVGLFGRSRTLCKFCGRVSGYPLNASIRSHCSRVRRFRQSFFLANAPVQGAARVIFLSPPTRPATATQAAGPNAAPAELRALELINEGKDIKASEVFFESVPCLRAGKTPQY